MIYSGVFNDVSGRFRGPGALPPPQGGPGEAPDGRFSVNIDGFRADSGTARGGRKLYYRGNTIEHLGVVQRSRLCRVATCLRGTADTGPQEDMSSSWRDSYWVRFASHCDVPSSDKAGPAGTHTVD